MPMEYLTPSLLAKAAPATQRLRDSSGTLLDTQAFLRSADERGYRPIYVAQGTPHGDAQLAPNRGRHLVVTADRTGSVIVLLNSHTVHRKAWMGIGFTNGGENPLFLIGAAIPIARWKGPDIPLEELAAYKPSLAAVREALEAWKLDRAGLRALARQLTPTVYLPGHRTCDPKALVPDEDMSAWDALYHMMRQVLTGSLPSSNDRHDFRRVKPIKGPDALMHAASTAFYIGLERAKASKVIDLPLHFPRYKKS